MSRYSGAYYKGAARDTKAVKRAEDEARQVKRFEDITIDAEQNAQSTG